MIIDVAYPSDVNVAKKEYEKVSKYGGLRVEVAIRWNLEAKVVPIVVGSLGMVSNNMVGILEEVAWKSLAHNLSKDCRAWIGKNS